MDAEGSHVQIGRHDDCEASSLSMQTSQRLFKERYTKVEICLSVFSRCRKSGQTHATPPPAQQQQQVKCYSFHVLFAAFGQRTCTRFLLLFIFLPTKENCFKLLIPRPTLLKSFLFRKKNKKQKCTGRKKRDQTHWNINSHEKFDFFFRF